MSPRFNNFIGFVKAHETVYAKGHPGDDAYALVERVKGDSGGTTKWGLDAATHGEGVAKLSWPEAAQIYWDWYWSGKTTSCQWVSVETLPAALGEIVFDTRINSGMGIAKRFLEATQDPLAFLNLRDARNRWIADKYPQDRKFLNGWLNRTADLRQFLMP
jgi:lysozyme family protein